MEIGPKDDPKLSKMKKEVVVGVRILKKSTRISSSSSSRSWIIRFVYLPLLAYVSSFS